MQDKKTKPVTMRLSYEVIDKIDDLTNKVKDIKKSNGDYSEVHKQDIVADCISLGAPIFEEQLKKKS